jgi:hypothetical protein
LNVVDVEGEDTTNKVYVIGFITDIDYIKDENLGQYGNITFKIAVVKGDYDLEIKLKAYLCYVLKKPKFIAKDQIKL